MVDEIPQNLIWESWVCVLCGYDECLVNRLKQNLIIGQLFQSGMMEQETSKTCPYLRTGVEKDKKMNDWMVHMNIPVLISHCIAMHSCTTSQAILISSICASDCKAWTTKPTAAEANGPLTLSF